MGSRRDVDIGIVDVVLAAIQKDPSRFRHLAQAESAFRGLRDVLAEHTTAPERPDDGLAALLDKNEELHAEAVVANAQVALGFVGEELAKWKDVRRRRPLTEGEKQSIQEYLDPLLEALGQLIGASKDTPDPGRIPVEIPGTAAVSGAAEQPPGQGSAGEQRLSPERREED